MSGTINTSLCVSLYERDIRTLMLEHSPPPTIRNGRVNNALKVHTNCTYMKCKNSSDLARSYVKNSRFSQNLLYYFTSKVWIIVPLDISLNLTSVIQDLLIWCNKGLTYLGQELPGRFIVYLNELFIWIRFL